MNLKKKFETAKDKMKEHSPAIISTLAVACVGVSAVLIREKMKLTLAISHDDLEELKTEDCNLTYSINGHDYSLGYRGKTPKS